jgi:DNA (cytosine-5)-methyltransferase 1
MGTKYRALDLFCCAGGAGMGLHRAGFEVVGVDIRPQPRYPFEFHQADALTFPLDGFDFIWASPPCQDYSALKGLAAEKRGKLIPAVRQRLKASGVPYTIENVVGSELVDPIVLCGSMFGLGVWRHRLFETSHPPLLVPACQHTLVPEPVDVTGTGGPFRGVRKTAGGGVSRKPNNLSHASAVMGIDWMTRKELSQAIPPAYAEFIGRAAITHLESMRAAA